MHLLHQGVDRLEARLVAPTFTAQSLSSTMRLEAFLLDHDGSDLYGQTMRIEFIERLRDEKRFESVEALMEQVHRDIARAREIGSQPLATEPDLTP